MVSAVLIPDTAFAKTRANIMPYEPSSEESDSRNGNANDNEAKDSESIADAPTWESAKASLEARKKRKRPTALLLKNAMEDLDRIWMNSSDEGHREQEEENANREATQTQSTATIPPSEIHRVRQTTDLLVKVLAQDIHAPAIRALVTNEDLKVTQTKLQSELDAKRKEVERLRRSEQRSKETIEKMLKSVNSSAEAAKDKSQTTLLEAKMRADLLHAISERDVAQKDSLSAQRSCDLLSGDVENLKNDKTKLQHDKLRLEREVRSARALADQLSSSLLGSDHHKEDLDYYKGKSKELEIHLQGMTARLAEKNQEIQELRRCNNRNLSQQRLEALRATVAPLRAAGESSTGSNSAKRPRKSH